MTHQYRWMLLLCLFLTLQWEDNVPGCSSCCCGCCHHLAGCRTFGRLVQNKRTDCEGRHSCEHMCTAVTVPYTCKPGLLQHIAVADSVAMCLASTCARAISRSHACVSRHYQAVEQEHPCCHAQRRHRAQTGSPVKSRKVG